MAARDCSAAWLLARGFRRLQARALRDRAVDETVQACHLGEVKAKWRREDLFENVGVLRLRQEVEDAPTVVVAHDHSGLAAPGFGIEWDFPGDHTTDLLVRQSAREKRSGQVGPSASASGVGGGMI